MKGEKKCLTCRYCIKWQKNVYICDNIDNYKVQNIIEGNVGFYLMITNPKEKCNNYE